MIPQANGPVHVGCIIMRNIMDSATEAEWGGLFENCQKSTSMQTDLQEMGHPPQPTTVATENSEVNSI